MSAPALHPAARMRPVLMERLARQRAGHCTAVLILATWAVGHRVDGGHVTYWAVVACVLLGGLVLPSLQGVGPGDQPAWDAALPVDPARHARVRLVCGVAGAALLLAAVAGLYGALFGDPAHPGWYPLALFAWGLTGYLLISATLLGTTARGPSLAYPVMCLPPAVMLLAAALQDPAQLGRMGVTAVLARTALPLGLAGAAAYAAARFQSRAPAPAAPAARYAPAPRREPARPRLDRPATRPVRRSGPARPSATLTVFRRHFALLGRFAIVPALTLLFFTWLVLMHLIAGPLEAGEEPTVRWFVESLGLPWWCAFMAFSWMIFVWLREHGAQRRWNDTLPVGTGTRRILHAAAGAAWLLLFLAVAVSTPLAAAAAAGTLASPADVPAWLWAGLPAWTLTLYLAATLVLFGTRLLFQAIPSVVPHLGPDRVLGVLPVRLQVPFAMVVMMLALIVGPAMFFAWGIGHLETLALAVTGDAGPRGGSHAASALRLVGYAAGAAAAIALNDWIHHADRLPTVREVRGVFRARVGRRPGPPLRGHAER